MKYDAVRSSLIEFGVTPKIQVASCYVPNERTLASSSPSPETGTYCEWLSFITTISIQSLPPLTGTFVGVERPVEWGFDSVILGKLFFAQVQGLIQFEFTNWRVTHLILSEEELKQKVSCLFDQLR